MYYNKYLKYKNKYLQLKNQFGGANAELELLEPIYSGASGSPVFHATVNGALAVCKVMEKSELDNLNVAQGAGVVRILYIARDLTSVKGTGAAQLQSRDDFPPGSAIVAMEKLENVQLHPDFNTKVPIIDTQYGLMLAIKTDTKYRMITPDKKRLGYLRDFIDAIVALNSKGLMWCDVKQENSGVDSDGHLRIFDFGIYTRPIDDNNRYIDIVAYGKLLYNALVQFYVFAPGRHCRKQRGALDQTQLISTVDLITGAPPGVLEALRKCFSLDSSSSSDNIERVVLLLLAALLELLKVSQPEEMGAYESLDKVRP
jgi:serine/threonine protein kinase